MTYVTAKTVFASLIALIMLCSNTVASAAEPDWIPVAESNDGIVVHVDAASIRIREIRLSAWVRYNFASAQPSTAGKLFRSSVRLYVVGCRSEQTGMAVYSDYSGSASTGEVVDTGAIGISAAPLSYSAPQTLAQAIMKFVCAHATQTELSLAQ